MSRRGDFYENRAALMGREFWDVIRFTKPPMPLQKAVFAVLGPIARRRRYRPLYPEYLHAQGQTTPRVDV